MSKIKNPFTVISPEQLDAQTAQQLFVEVFSDFPQIRNPGHSMIVGARGSGKSMMFRCLLPDVRMLIDRISFSELDFLAFHVRIKNTELNITDLLRLDHHHASNLINEHFFTLNVLTQILESLANDYSQLVSLEAQKLSVFFEKVYVRRLRLCRCDTPPELVLDSAQDFFTSLHDHACMMHLDVLKYVAEISPNLSQPAPSYNLPLLSYLRFLVPFLKGLRQLLGTPEANTYVFIDDADNLSNTQTKILNGWLSTRTGPKISIKVSTQVGKYKSHITPSGTLVESPHDYQEVNISDLYTTSKTSYYNRVKDITDKRLKLAGLKDTTAEQFFPSYKKQEDAIQEEAQRLRDEWETKGKGHRPSDDALRYARPNYIRDLGGSRKSRHTYQYAGFEQLVHLSSGIVRVFLDAAAKMFDDTAKKHSKTQNQISSIPSSIQDTVIREKSEKMMFSHFQKLAQDEDTLSGTLGITQKLQNLISSMGHTFHDILLSDRSERRVFSIALSNHPTDEIAQVLELGVQTGYLHVATIGNKNGTGKTWLYILNRCLAPQFSLDPTGFAGYLFVTNDNLRNAMQGGGNRLRELNTIDEPDQLDLFD